MQNVYFRFPYVAQKRRLLKLSSLIKINVMQQEHFITHRRVFSLNNRQRVGLPFKFQLLRINAKFN